MKRREIIALIACALAEPVALAQPVRVPRIGYLLLVPFTDPPSRERQAFLEGLGEFGYLPDKTLEIVYRSA
jgi:hypothetical protein